MNVICYQVYRLCTDIMCSLSHFIMLCCLPLLPLAFWQVITIRGQYRYIRITGRFLPLTLRHAREGLTAHRLLEHPCHHVRMYMRHSLLGLVAVMVATLSVGNPSQAVRPIRGKRCYFNPCIIKLYGTLRFTEKLRRPLYDLVSTLLLTRDWTHLPAMYRWGGASISHRFSYHIVVHGDSQVDNAVFSASVCLSVWCNGAPLYKHNKIDSPCDLTIYNNPYILSSPNTQNFQRSLTLIGISTLGNVKLTVNSDYKNIIHNHLIMRSHDANRSRYNTDHPKWHL